MVPQELVDLARAAFEAYKEAVGGLSVTHDPIPDWEEVSDKVQLGWIASTKVAYAAGYRDADSGPAKEPLVPTS